VSQQNLKKICVLKLALKKFKVYNLNMRFFPYILLLLPVLALASPAEEPEESNIPILEATQDLFGFNVNRVANRLDTFFADQRADDELARSLIRVRRRYEVRERAELQTETQFRFNVRLPRLQEKFRFEFKSNKKAKAEQIKNENAALKELKNLSNWQFRADIGVNASIPPMFFTRGRLRNTWQSWVFVNRFVQELSWYSDRAWEEMLTLDSDLSLQEDLLLRFRNIVDWRITNKEFGTSHGPSLIHQLSINEAISYGANLSIEVDEGTWFLSNYRLSSTYRRNLYKQWLYLDLTPGLDFPKLWNFRRTPFIFLQLEALFGGN
jgi:hypothetical protein